jgi:peptidoglycan/xylan/chitin deacetylase (PgdA/CDA1 family)
MFSRLKRLIRAHISRHDALILTYHSILPEPLPFPISQHLSAERFAKQIGYLAKNFRCVSLATLVNELNLGAIKPYTVTVTFDDGFRNNYTTAFPILKQYRVPATIFIPTQYIGSTRLLWPEYLACILALSKHATTDILGRSFPLRTPEEKTAAYKALTRSFKAYHPDDIDAEIEHLMQRVGLSREEVEQSSVYSSLRMLDWPEIDELRESRLIEIGSHTISHRRLHQLSTDEALYEIVESRRDLEQKIGKVKWFAYPYGGREDDFTDEHRNMAIQAGYEAIATCMAGTINRDSSVYELPRLTIGANISDEAFDYLLQGGTALGATSPLERLKRALLAGKAHQGNGKP